MDLLARLGIGPKIYCVVGLLCAGALGLSVYMSNALLGTDDKYTALFDNEVTFALKLERMRGDMANMGRQINNVLLLPDASGLPALVKAIGDIQKTIGETDAAVTRLAKPEHKAAVARMTATMASVYETLPRVYAAVEAGDRARAATVYGEKGRPQLVETFNAAATLSDAVNADVIVASNGLTDDSNATVLRALVVAAVGLLVGIAASVLIAVAGISRPIARLKAVMEALARGELATAVEGRDRRDEVGAMAQAVEVFKTGLIRSRDMEQEAKRAEAEAAAEKRRAMLDLAGRFEERVGTIVDSVGGASAELQATASQLAAAVEQVGAQCAAVAAASEEASSNVQTVASASEEMSAAIHQLSERVGQAAGRSKAAAEGAGQAQRELDGLSAAIEQVDQIVAAINSVAAQTNLLALNATIEAARAGDAGKGFAVVASEVKNLANQTHAMTEQISGNLTAVKSASGRTVDAMRAIITQVGEINHSTVDMASSVEQQSAATSEISRNAQQAAGGTVEVSRNVGGIQQAEHETSAATNNVKRAADSLAGQSAMLKQEMDNFLAEIRAA